MRFDIWFWGNEVVMGWVPENPIQGFFTNPNPTQTWPEPDLNLTQDLLPNNITNVNIVAGPSSLHIRGLHDKGDGRSQDWNFD